MQAIKTASAVLGLESPSYVGGQPSVSAVAGCCLFCRQAFMVHNDFEPANGQLCKERPAM